MNFELEKQWRALQKKLGEKIGENPEINSILFVIGLQELNIEFNKLTKDQKVEVMHIGLCVVFAPQGYYKPIGRDQDGWIHFDTVKKFPKLNADEQEEIIKEAIIEYYEV